jgi:UDP-N-acetylglucosamine 2-epimerase (non-hydrolysing)
MKGNLVLMKSAIIVGTRPEIIKMSPVIREFERLQTDYFILHTGQHYSYNMDRVFFEQLELPESRYNIDVGSGTHAEQTGKMLIGIEKILKKEKPDVILVQGDTNTVLAGALSACKMNMYVGHVEAGLRSYDRSMPEEINRVLADHVSDFLFAPTETSKKILLSEGLSEEKIFITGNTIVDAVIQNQKISDKKSKVLERFGLKKDDYFLVTIHRQENVDDKYRFTQILEGLSQVKKKYDKEIFYPIHPRSMKRVNEFNLDSYDINLIDPVDYLDFLKLEENAKLVFTDSGGVQEETCIIGVPCITLRDNTERPETVDVGSNIIAGTNPENILKSVSIMLDRKKGWENPFGEGNSGKKIIDILMERVS